MSPTGRKGKVHFIMQKRKIMTAEQYSAAQERSAQVRTEIARHHVPMTVLAFYVGVSEQSLYRWLRAGLNEDQFMDVLDAIGNFAAAERR